MEERTQDGEVEGRQTQPLEVVLRQWIQKAMPRWIDTRVDAMARRLGWAGRQVSTLEEAGQLAGVTRERIRQIQRKLETRLARVRPSNLEALHAAAVLLAESDDPSRSPGQLLKDAGLSREPLAIDGVRRFVRLAHLANIVDLDAVLSEMDEWEKDTAPMVREARRLAGAVGIVSIDWLQNSMPDVEHPRCAISGVLQPAAWASFLDDTWFWSPKVPRARNRTRNLMRKMLAACGPLPTRDIVAGLDRQRRLGRLPRLPSAQAIRLFAAAHPEFVVDPSGAIAPSEPLDPIEELDRTEETLYLILAQSEDGFLDRQEFQEQAIARGVNENTFNVYTSYSVILDNPAVDRWALRGARISPAALAAHSRARRRRRYVRTEWLPDGTLRVERELPTLFSAVISIPTALTRFVAGRDFSASDITGADLGTIRFNESGGSWGYSRFIEMQQMKVGDIVRLDVNLASSTVRLSRSSRQG